MMMRTISTRYTIVVILWFAFSCGTKPSEKPLFDLVENTGISFNNTVANTPTANIFSYRNFYNGGGAAIGDINNDGLG